MSRPPIAVFAALALALALAGGSAAWFLRRPVAFEADNDEVPGPDLPAAPDEAAPPASAAPRTATPRGIDPALGVEQQALAVYAAAARVTFVDCPRPAGDGWVLRHPGRWVGDLDSLAFTAEHPEGAALVADTRTAAARDVLRWATAPDGRVTCAGEAPKARGVPFLVRDAAGAPAVGAVAESPASAKRAVAGADGRLTLEVYSDAAFEAEFFLGDRGTAPQSFPVSGEAREVSLPAGGPSRSAAREAERLARLEVERADLAAALEDPGLPPAVGKVLTQWSLRLDEKLGVEAP